jgi:hypothetical protein
VLWTRRAVVIGEVERDIVVDLHDEERTERGGFSQAEDLSQEGGRFRLSRTRTIVWFSCTLTVPTVQGVQHQRLASQTALIGMARNRGPKERVSCPV